MVVLAHADIRAFSRDGYMQKNHPKLHTYTAILKIVTYVATHKVFKVKID